MHGGEQRRAAVIRERQWQPVEMVVDDVEVTRARQGMRDVQRLGHPAVRGRIVGVPPFAHAVEPGRGDRIQCREECHVHARGCEAVGEQTRHLLPRPVVARRSPPGHRPEQADPHREASSATSMCSVLSRLPCRSVSMASGSSRATKSARASWPRFRSRAMTAVFAIIMVLLSYKSARRRRAVGHRDLERLRSAYALCRGTPVSGCPHDPARSGYRGTA